MNNLKKLEENNLLKDLKVEAIKYLNSVSNDVTAIGLDSKTSNISFRYKVYICTLYFVKENYNGDDCVRITITCLKTSIYAIVTKDILINDKGGQYYSIDQLFIHFMKKMASIL